MKKTIIALSAALSLFGCAQDIDLPIDYPGDRIIATGFGQGGGGAEVLLQRTKPFLGKLPDKPLVARVRLFEDGLNRCDFVKKPDGIFYTPDSVRLREGKTYHIEIEAEGFDKIYSRPEAMPRAVQIDSLKTARKPNTGSEYDCVIGLQDLPGKNYYLTKIDKYLLGEWIGSPPMRKYYEPHFAFDDLLFEGKTHYKKLTFDRRDNYVGGTGKTADAVSVKLYSLSPAAHRFFVDLVQNDYTTDAFFTEPTIVESNIEGGYGVFGLMSADSVVLRF